jgi:2-phospho-L-lactate guanylyltransferase
MDAGILPVKRLDQAKQRLSPDFTEPDRQRIARALLDDAFALCESVGFLTWFVASDDDDVLAAAANRGFEAVRDRGEGLNAAVGLAIDVARAAGAGSVTTIPCDVPLAYEGDLVDLLDTGATSDVVVVPSERDGGTNGLYVSPPDLLAPRFGEGSLRRHIDLAEQRSLRCALLSLPRLSLDIDTVQDVRDFLAKPAHAPSRTRDVLLEMEVPGSG